MKKVILWSILAFTCHLSQAQNADSVLNMSLEQLMNIEVESVSKRVEKLSETSMSVYVVSKEEMDRWGVRYLYETVQRVPGYSFYNTDYYGQYGVIARGYQSIWRFGCSVELMPLNDFGHFGFPVNFYKNMEISRGPGGLAWGSNANAGLMNLNLRDDINGVEFVGSYGNQNYYNASLMSGGKFDGGNGEFFIGYDVEGMDYFEQENAFGIPGAVWRENGQRPSQNITAKFKYKNIKFLMSYDAADHTSPYVWFGKAFEYDDATSSYVKTDLGRMWDSIQGKTGVEPHDQLEFIAYRTEYKLPFENKKMEVSLYHNYYKRTWHLDPVAILGDSRRDVGFNFNYNFSDKFSVNAGGDLWGRSRLKQHYETHRFAEDYGISWFDNDLTFEDKDYSNVYAQANMWLHNKFKLIVGVRADYQSSQGEDWMITGPRLGLVYVPTKKITVKYLYNRAPRKPQANELANSNPSPEVLSAHELVGFLSVSDVFNASATLFYQSLDDMINRVDLDGGLNTFNNMGGIQTKGVELSLNYLPSPRLRFYYNSSIFDTKVIEGKVTIDGKEYTESEKRNSKDEALFVPFYTGFIGGEAKIGNILRGSLSLRTILKVPYIAADNLTEKYASVNFIDFSVTTRKFKDAFQVSFNALNVLNTKSPMPAYGEHAGRRNGTIEPEGRRFYLKVVYTAPFMN